MTPKANFRPGMIPFEVLKHHAHIIGGTGVGKTRAIIVPIEIQILEARIYSLLHLDLKGDPFAFNALRTKAEELGIPFKFFTLDPRLAGCLWNFLADPAFQDLTPSERAGLKLDACGLSHGDGYGPSFHGNAAGHVAQGLAEAFPAAASAYEMTRILAKKNICRDLRMTAREFEAASGILSPLATLADLPQANCVGGMSGIEGTYLANALRIDEPLTRPSVYYMHLPAGTSPSLAKLISRAAIKLCYTRAVSRNGKGPHLFVVVDELAETLQRMFSSPLRAARSFNVSFLLVHQALTDLKNADLDMMDVVLGNTAIRIAGNARDEAGMKYWNLVGGEKTFWLKSKTTTTSTTPQGRSRSESVQWREVKGPRFDAEAIARVNANPRLAFVNVSPASEFWPFTRPVVVELMEAYSRDEYDALSARGWPEPRGTCRCRVLRVQPVDSIRCSSSFIQAEDGRWIIGS